MLDRSKYRLPTGIVVLIAFLLVGCGSGARQGESAGTEHLDAAEMEEAIKDALKRPSIPSRILRLAKLGDGLDRNNAEGLGRALEEVVSSTDNIELRWMMSRWAEIDPTAAFDSVMRWKLESKRMVGAAAVANEWARSGGALEARTYIESLEQTRVKGIAIRTLVGGWAQSDDLDGLTNYIVARDKIASREKLTELLVNSLLSSRGVEGVMAWADSIPTDTEGRYKKTAYKKALRQVANRDPRAAAKWYESQRDTDYVRRSASVIGGEWAEHDPLEGLAWILSQPEGLERQVALQRWTARWASYDRAGMETWMETADFAQDDLREIPGSYVSTLLPGFPQKAAPWVEKIVDENDRMTAVQNVAKMWIRIDPEATSEFLAKHGASEELLNAPRSRRRGRAANAGPEAVKMDDGERASSEEAAPGESGGDVAGDSS